MSEFDIKVVGARSPQKRKGKLKRFAECTGKLIKALLMRPRLMVMAGLAGFVLLIGTPHAGWDYQCSHKMRGPGSCQAVSWCAYYGIQGRRIDVPPYGQSCSLIKVLPLDFERLLGG
ncbi:hypothetical protein [Hoeflea sp.]|uniref:hypothetical protein n=1 Tax=Hoeflea sp. TaxID=1940281 RepID=UPI003B024ED0